MSKYYRLGPSQNPHTIQLWREGLSAWQQPLCTAHVVTVSLSSCPLRVSSLVTELV